jgi:phosphoglycolate phosphatase-like HAD superfamily hydrolase
MSKAPAVIFDMDGTLCDVTSVRHHVLDRHRRNYKAFHYLSVFCPPIAWVRNLAELHHMSGNKVIVVTARKEEWRTLTEAWLMQHDVRHEALHMRGQDDMRKDKLVKGEILDLLLESYDIEHAYDDNPSIIELWQERGVPHTVVPGWAEEYTS